MSYTAESQAVGRHVLPRTVDLAKELGKDGLIIMNMCGRGDKDVFTIADALGEHISEGTEGHPKAEQNQNV